MASAITDLMLSLETQPIVGQLLIAFNHMCRHLKAWQVGGSSILVYLLVIRLKQILTDDISVLQQVKNLVFRFARKIPQVQSKIDSEVTKTRASFEHSMVKHPENWNINHALPNDGKSDNEIMEIVDSVVDFEKVAARQNAGKVSGTIYVGGENFAAYSAMLTKVYGVFSWSNPLHPGVFPGLRQMEAEVVSMVKTAFNGKEKTCGVMTSGGTESIIMALKAYRDWARDVKGITKPNIVAPRTAHPAFDKGCQYFNIGIRKVQEDTTTRKVSVAAMRRAANSNTICLVGSAPQYPHGAVDPIAGLSALALELDVGLHVDCCLGSFLVPFMRKAGFEFPDFDFTLPGVTTISCDTHKYGYAPKGSSVLLYSNHTLRSYQYSLFTDWPGGIYGTPTIAGSRAGALVAATWASLMHHGESGYVKNTKTIIDITRKIADGIKRIPGLKLVCTPEVSVVAWTSDVFDINRMSLNLIDKKGWDLNVLQFPSSIHIAITMAHSNEGVAESFLADLAECSAELVATKDVKAAGSAALYGMSQAIPDRSIIQDIMKAYMDTMYVTDMPKKLEQ